MLKEKDDYLSNPVFQQYLGQFRKLDIPKEYMSKDYYINEIKRRRIISYYIKKIRKFPLRDFGQNEERLKIKSKKKNAEMTLTKISPLLDCGLCSAERLAQESSEENLRLLTYLLSEMITEQMAHEYNDSTLEDSYLWYQLNLIKGQLYSNHRRLNSYECEHIMQFALASVMGKRYRTDRLAVSSTVQKIVVCKYTVDQMLRDYNVSCNSPEIVETLQEQGQRLKLVPTK